jgi:hypothetical protein
MLRLEDEDLRDTTQTATPAALQGARGRRGVGGEQERATRTLDEPPLNHGPPAYEIVQKKQDGAIKFLLQA